MSMYVIILHAPSEDAWSRLKEAWPSHKVKNEHVAFISAEDKNLTADIAENVGIGADGPTGSVVQMDYFAGYSSSSLAEWMS